MKDLFKVATAIDAAFVVKAQADDRVIVAFTEADAKAMQAYYDNDDVDLSVELGVKMTLLADAYAQAFHPVSAVPVHIEADNDTTARGLFARVVPALVFVKANYSREAYAKGLLFSAPKVNCPPLDANQMAEHVAECQAIADTLAEFMGAATEAAATAVKH